MQQHKREAQLSSRRGGEPRLVAEGRLLQEPEGVGGAPPEGRGVIPYLISLYQQALTGSALLFCVSVVLFFISPAIPPAPFT